MGPYIDIHQLWNHFLTMDIFIVSSFVCAFMLIFFFYVNLLQGNAVLPQNIGAKEEYQCSLTLKFINVRLKLAVFCSSEFEVFFSLIISGFHQMHLV